MTVATWLRKRSKAAAYAVISLSDTLQLDLTQEMANDLIDWAGTEVTVTSIYPCCIFDDVLRCDHVIAHFSCRSHTHTYILMQVIVVADDSGSMRQIADRTRGTTW